MARSIRLRLQEYLLYWDVNKFIDGNLPVINLLIYGRLNYLDLIINMFKNEEIRINIDNKIEDPNKKKDYFNPDKKEPLNQEESQKLVSELRHLVDELQQRKRKFKDRSRLFCCGCFSLCIMAFLIVFYLFDTVKYEETCKKGKKFQMEICEAPSIGFWTRFFLFFIPSVFLVLGLYCTGPTVVIFDPKHNKLTIDKKKLLFLPSVMEFPIDSLRTAYIESDYTDGTPNISTFSFYSVNLVFDTSDDAVVTLGLGRDCFFLQEKNELVNSINNYLNAINLFKD